MKGAARAVVKAAIGVATITVALGCGSNAGAKDGGAGDGGASDGTVAGLRLPAAVVMVNPTINDLHNAGVPDTLGHRGAGVTVALGSGRERRTNAAGVAVLESLPVGETAMTLDGQPAPPLKIMGPRELVDTALAFDGTETTLFSGFPHRQSFDGEVVVVGPDEPERIAEAMEEDNAIIVLEPGTYRGTYYTLQRGVSLVGPGIVGELDGEKARVPLVRGFGDNTVRGVVLESSSETPGSSTFAFNRVLGNTTVKGSNQRVLGNTFCGAVSVIGESSNNVVLGNRGIGGDSPPDDACE